MLCVSIDDDDSLLLWNPSTGDHKTLPVPEKSGIREGVCGLGYDPTTGYYKVVSVLNKSAVHVFSVKSNSWEKIGGLHFPYIVYNEGIPINGCIYWSASKTYKIGDLIIRLSLSDLKVSEVPTPVCDLSHFAGSVWRTFSVTAEVNLLAWGNSLCLYRQFDQTMWTLKEEQDDEIRGGIRFVWTHRMTLPQLPRCYYELNYRLQPKCFTKTGRLVVLAKHKRYVLLDGHHFQDLDVRGLNEGFHTSVVYTESLISPHSI